MLPAFRVEQAGRPSSDPDLESILLELAHQRAVADLQLSGGELTVTLDVSQCLGKLVTFELLMNAARGFFQGTRQVQKIPPVHGV